MTLPPLPDHHAIGVLVLTAVALILFTREKIPLESSALVVLVALTLGFELFPYSAGESRVRSSDFFLGFGHQALVAVCALMVMGQSLVRTGALEPIGRSLARAWRVRPTLSLLLTLLTGAILSAFVNNTPIVVLMLPILVNVSLRTGKSASRTLMSMGFATLLGGMATTIGTSTNLLVVTVAADMGVESFSMFDFVRPAAIAGAVAILYLWLVVPRIMPERHPPMEDTSPRVFSAQIRIRKDSFADGKTLAAIIEKTGGEINVKRVRRGENVYLSTLPDVVIQAGDMLLVEDTPERLREFHQSLGGQLYSDDQRVDEDHPLQAASQQIAEVVVTAGSRLANIRVSDARLASKYRLTLLAIHRAGEEVPGKEAGMDNRILRSGDVLLIQGSSRDISAVRRSGELLVLDGTADMPHTRKAPLALITMVAVISLAASGILPIAVSALCGVIVLVVTGCIDWKDVSRGLSAQVILIIVASLALGNALMLTGGADFLAQAFVAVTDGLSPGMVLAGLMLLMAILTNVVSNNAAAVVGTPIAISIAQRLGLPVEPFVLAVLFGANMSFATPMAYQTNLLVMNAGGYKFSDFVRIGVPLAVIMWVVLSWVLTYAYRL